MWIFLYMGYTWVYETVNCYLEKAQLKPGGYEQL